MASIRAFVENVVYYNEDNYYAVLEVSEGDDLFTAVGHFPYISSGETIEAEGEYTLHPVYGQQFSVTSFEVIKPERADMIERYLAGGAIKGIGPSLAQRIVKKFRADTLRIMEEEPERLSEIKGISESMAIKISEQMELKRGFRDAVMYMQQYGIGSNLAQRIYECYGPALYAILEKNPYRLADDIDGVGFKLADSIARRIGFSGDSEYRIKCGIVYSLQEGVAQGHTWLPEGELINFAADLLSAEPEEIRPHLLDLQIEGRIVISAPQGGVSVTEDFISAGELSYVPFEEDGIRPVQNVSGDDKTGAADFYAKDPEVYLASCYYVEKDIASRLSALNVRGESDEEQVSRRISEICSETEIELDEKQKEAVRATVDNGVSILTGGPGTGKTTTINSIIRYYEKDNYTIMLAAPTGRAAKRMTEATGREAKTIHRLLEYTGAPGKSGRKMKASDIPGDGGLETGGRGRFLRNEKDPLECDVLIVDEMSMVDIFLMDALLKAVVPGTRVVFVGDANQLPSVGAGNVLKDMIVSDAFSTACLSHIFRQAAESDIVTNAHRIQSGERVDLSKKSRDFIFIRGNDAEKIAESVRMLITKKLPPYIDAGVYDIQVLTPTRKGALGVEALNRELQEFLNPGGSGKKEKKYGDTLFREGDKVMQIKNDYDIEWTKLDKSKRVCEKGAGVFNGDMGKILSIDPHADVVRVEYDEGRIVEYAGKELGELELSYAVTVHKSQGSEYPAVVIPMYYGPSMLMNRNLLYTAVTRARKCVCLVGIPQVFEKMAGNIDESRRCSGLKNRIEELRQ